MIIVIIVIIVKMIVMFMNKDDADEQTLNQSYSSLSWYLKCNMTKYLHTHKLTHRLE